MLPDQMALGKFCRVAHVQQLRTRVSPPEHFVERHGVQNPLQVGLERYPLAGVQDGVVGEVLRSVGLVGRNQADEFFLRHWLQGVVHTALISQRRDRVGGKLLAAERACAMRGVDQGFIGQGQELVVQRVV